MHGGILLLPHAVYWDDWVLYGASKDAILETFEQAGAMFNWAGHLHVSLLGAGVWTYKVLTFALMFLSGVLLHSILTRTGLLSRSSTFFATLLFLVLPFNLARIAAVDFPYTLCYFLFFAGWYLIDRNRLLSLALFFLSFNTNSLLVFYALPALDALYRHGLLARRDNIPRYALRNLDFLVLPFVYYVIKTNFFSPYGMYEGYNQSISLLFVPPAVAAQWADLTNFAVNPFLVLIFALLAFAILAIRASCDLDGERYTFSYSARTASVGLLALTLGALPYWVLGLVPTFVEWTSRHQLLLPLGGALLITAALDLMKNRSRPLGYAVALGCCMAYGTETYYRFAIDWTKQTMLMKQLALEKEVETASLIIVNDETENDNALGRNFRFYEWNGMLAETFGDQRRFVVRPEELDSYLKGARDKFFSERYKAADHRRGPSSAVVRVHITRAATTAPEWREVQSRYELTVSNWDAGRMGAPISSK